MHHCRPHSRNELYLIVYADFYDQIELGPFYAFQKYKDQVEGYIAAQGGKWCFVV